MATNQEEADQEEADQMIKSYNDRFTLPLSVTFSGPLAAEIRRVSENLHLQAGAFVRIKMAEVLAKEFGINVR